jgi:DNA-binding helix-hairpin-helix protein with protein kinase domain
MANQSALLSPGSRLQTMYSHRPVIVGDMLGGGGQGQVFRAQFEDSFCALKWYIPRYLTLDPTLRERLEKSIEVGPPNNQFWWPFELVTDMHATTFGYLMPLREPGFETLVDYMRGRVDASFPTMILTSFHLADSFLRLHAKGLCYKDISFGNVFFHPRTGDVRICDIDNVDVNGRPGAILGTPGFMAPEVILRQAGPSTQTDLHSLAVMLFNILMMGDPLDGQRSSGPPTPEAVQAIYGSNPIFVFDPEDASNRPVPGEQDQVIARWNIYPRFIRTLFIRAFTAGLRDPLNGRVREGEWREAMAHLHDALFPCNYCGGLNFYDREQLKLSGGRLGNCWGCGQQPALPPRLRLCDNIVMLPQGRQLYSHHLGNQRAYNFTSPLAEISAEPAGLKNLSPQKWVRKAPDGSFTDVPPGSWAALANGAKLFFGSVEGEVRM